MTHTRYVVCAASTQSRRDCCFNFDREACRSANCTPGLRHDGLDVYFKEIT